MPEYQRQKYCQFKIKVHLEECVTEICDLCDQGLAVSVPPSPCQHQDLWSHIAMAVTIPEEMCTA